MKFISLFLLLLVITGTPAKAQSTSIDSLITAAQNTKDDTLRLKLYQRCGFYYAESKWDSALYFIDKALLLTQSLHQQIYEAILLDNKSYTLMSMGSYSKALQFSLKALDIVDDPSSRNAGDTASDELMQKRRSHARANIQYNMGILFGATGNITKQIEWYQKAIRIAASLNDIDKQTEIKLSLGEVYLGMGKLDSALLLAQESYYAMQASQQVLLKKYMGQAALTVGKVFAKKQMRDSALKYYNLALDINKEYGNQFSTADVNLSLSELSQSAGQLNEAEGYGWKALEKYKEVRSPRGVAASLNRLSSIYVARNKPDSALKLLQTADIIKDSINKVEKKNLFDFQNVDFDEQLKTVDLEKKNIQTQSRIRVYSLIAGLVVFLVIALILFRNNKQKQLSNQQLQQTLQNLKSTQSQLIQSEKMASLGELTAGIAHEIQNPLNFVNNFSEVSNELIDEMNVELDKGDINEAKAIAADVKQNLEKINHHGNRAGDIVKGMLQHSRSSTGVKEPTDINALADEYLRLSYHGLRAKDKNFNATMKTDFDETIGKVNIVPQDIGRVLLNLFNNAFYAVNQQISHNLISYEPIVSVTTKKSENHITITVSDNGNGIPQQIVDKIFQPFFTTKPTGQGTGLGLSLSYDIVKAHGGELKVGTLSAEAAAQAGKEARPPARLDRSGGDDPVGRGEGLSPGEAGTIFTIELPVA